MSKPTSEEIVTVLKQKVRDPELGMNIVDLGLVYNVEISDKNTAEVTMTLTSPAVRPARKSSPMSSAKRTMPSPNWTK